MQKVLFNNTTKCIRFILKKERIYISIWIAVLVIMTIAQAYSFVDLYPTAIERQAVAQTMDNPAVITMIGKAYGIDNYTLGALFSNQTLLLTAVVAAIMSILMVSRNTRGDEDTGRTEIILSLPVGRLSNTFAIIIVVISINFITALVMGVGLYALKIESLDLTGSLLFGISVGVIGIIFASISLLIAQLSSSARGTVGFSFCILGFSYLLRAIGDIRYEILALISPLGMILRSKVYVGNSWWPSIIIIVVSIVTILLSLYFNSVRDFGAGAIAVKPGRKRASIFLQNILGLGIRIQRNTIIAWLTGIFIVSIAYGMLLCDIEIHLESSEIMKNMFTYGNGHSVIQQFSTVLMGIVAMINTLPVLLSILILKSEEKTGRIENLISRTVSRSNLLGSFLTISIVFSFALQFLFGLGFWYAGSNVLSSPLSFADTIASSLVYLPGIWVFLGLSVFLLCCLPKLTILIWVYYSYSFFVIFMGSILQLPDWLVKLSPYGIIPKIPIDDVDYIRIITIIVISIIFMVLGFIGYNKRDLQDI